MDLRTGGIGLHVETRSSFGVRYFVNWFLKWCIQMPMQAYITSIAICIAQVTLELVHYANWLNSCGLV